MIRTNRLITIGVNQSI